MQYLESVNKQAEKEYIEKIALGDQQAFKELFVLSFPKVKHFITHLIKSESVAEDLAQDVFFKIWTGRESLPAIQYFGAYLYRMAKNAVINQVKSEMVEEKYIHNHLAAQHTQFSIEEDLYAQELELLVQLSVNNMPKQRKLVYEMSRIEGLTNDEIALTLNLSKKTIENHLNLALKEIRKTISLFSLFFL